MLVLTRKRGERLVLADSIVVTVLDVRRGNVRLGIAAPAHVHILREEVRNRPPRRGAGPAPVTAQT